MAVELLCCETARQNATVSLPDTVLLSDERVLQRLLVRERNYLAPAVAYLNRTQDCEIQPHMRKIVATWMLEVCEEQGCEDSVFPSAINYFDRFLTVTRLRKSQLQLLGAVCLLLASKFRQMRPLSLDTLVYYTDYSVRHEEMMSWELMVLSRLGWDLSCVTASDLVEHLLTRLPTDRRDTIARHANVFIALCAVEHRFSSYPPSVLASASVAVAAQGLPQLHKQWRDLKHLLSMLTALTGVQTDCLEVCVAEIESVVAANMASTICAQQSLQQQQQSSGNKCMTPPAGLKAYPHALGKPETPTDVQDIHF